MQKKTNVLHLLHRETNTRVCLQPKTHTDARRIFWILFLKRQSTNWKSVKRREKVWISRGHPFNHGKMTDTGVFLSPKSFWWRESQYRQKIISRGINKYNHRHQLHYLVTGFCNYLYSGHKIDNIHPFFFKMHVYVVYNFWRCACGTLGLFRRNILSWTWWVGACKR